MLTTFYSLLGAVGIGIAISPVSNIVTGLDSAIPQLVIHFMIGVSSGLTFVKLYNFFELRSQR